jgi:hypothetical protein
VSFIDNTYTTNMSKVNIAETNLIKDHDTNVDKLKRYISTIRDDTIPKIFDDNQKLVTERNDILNIEQTKTTKMLTNYENELSEYDNTILEKINNNKKTLLLLNSKLETLDNLSSDLDDKINNVKRIKLSLTESESEKFEYIHRLNGEHNNISRKLIYKTQFFNISDYSFSFLGPQDKDNIFSNMVGSSELTDHDKNSVGMQITFNDMYLKPFVVPVGDEYPEDKIHFLHHIKRRTHMTLKPSGGLCYPFHNHTDGNGTIIIKSTESDTPFGLFKDNNNIEGPDDCSSMLSDKVFFDKENRHIIFYKNTNNEQTVGILEDDLQTWDKYVIGSTEYTNGQFWIVGDDRNEGDVKAQQYIVIVKDDKYYIKDVKLNDIRQGDLTMEVTTQKRRIDDNVHVTYTASTKHITITFSSYDEEEMHTRIRMMHIVPKENGNVAYDDVFIPSKNMSLLWADTWYNCTACLIGDKKKGDNGFYKEKWANKSVLVSSVYKDNKLTTKQKEKFKGDVRLEHKVFNEERTSYKVFDILSMMGHIQWNKVYDIHSISIHCIDDGTNNYSFMVSFTHNFSGFERSHYVFTFKNESWNIRTTDEFGGNYVGEYLMSEPFNKLSKVKSNIVIVAKITNTLSRIFVQHNNVNIQYKFYISPDPYLHGVYYGESMYSVPFGTYSYDPILYGTKRE